MFRWLTFWVFNFGYIPFHRNNQSGISALFSFIKRPHSNSNLNTKGMVDWRKIEFKPYDSSAIRSQYLKWRRRPNDLEIYALNWNEQFIAIKAISINANTIW